MTGKRKTALLCAMMFLQFFVWGAWYVSTGGFVLNAMHWSGDVNGWVYSVGPIAAIVSPIILGLVADRYFPSQIALGAMHLLGGALMLLAPSLAEPGASPTPFILVLAGHMLCYMPTLGLTNTIAFTHIEDQARQFPLIRVFGTVGWIAANWVVAQIGELTTGPFYLAAGAAIALGLFSFFLPDTPPPAAGKKVSLAETFGLGALHLFKSRAFTVFLLSSFLICIPLAGYYSFAQAFAQGAFGDGTTRVMSYGQIAEVVFMLVMPWFFLRLGVKWMLAVGMLAWVLRYGLFAGGADGYVPWMILGGILLHGICYDFFFVTGQIYVDQRASPQIRGQAQSFLVVVTQGFGLGIGAQLMGAWVESNKSGEGAAATFDWTTIWILPCAFAAVILVAFLLLFADDRATPPPTTTEGQEP